MEKLLTIVVPVYKVEPYINKCLDSLILPEELMENIINVTDFISKKKNRKSISIALMICISFGII